MKKRIFALIMSVLLVVSSAAGAFATTEPNRSATDVTIYNDSVSAMPGYFNFVKVAANDRYVMRCDETEMIVSIEDRLTGQVWYSSPPVAVSENSGLEGQAITAAFSMMVVQIINESGLTSTAYSKPGLAVNCEVTHLANGIRFDYDFIQSKIKIPVVFILTDNGVEASIVVNEIKEEGANHIISIDFLRYFGAAPTGTDGYFVVPDGSGAVINFDNGKNNATLEYDKPIYGPDASEYTSRDVETSRQEVITLPVWGVVSQTPSYTDQAALTPLYNTVEIVSEGIKSYEDAIKAFEALVDAAVDACEETADLTEEVEELTAELNELTADPEADPKDVEKAQSKLAKAQEKLDEAKAAEPAARQAAVDGIAAAKAALDNAKALYDMLAGSVANLPEEYKAQGDAALADVAGDYEKLEEDFLELEATAKDPLGENAEEEPEDAPAETPDAEAPETEDADVAVATETEGEPVEDEAVAEDTSDDTTTSDDTVAPDGEDASDAEVPETETPDVETPETETPDAEGSDAEAAPETEDVVEEKVPMYGFLAEVTSGAENADLHMAVSGHTLVGEYNIAYTRFTYRKCYKVPLKGAGSDANDVMFEAEDPTSLDTYTVTYRFSETDETSYTSLANMYRNVLINRGWLTDEGTVSEKLYLELYGAVEKKKSMAGIVYNARETLTSFAEAQKILQELKQDGQVNNVQVVYQNFSDDYFEGDMQIDLDASGSLGGQADLAALLQYANADAGVGVALAADFQSFYNGGNGVSTFWDVADVINISPIEVYPFSLNANAMDTSDKPYYLLDPAKYSMTVDTLLASAAEHQYGALYFDAEALQLYSDLAPEGYQSERTSKAQQEQFARIAADLDVTMSNPNAFLYKYADNIVDIPVCSSKELIFDQDIPFLQTVLRGAKNFSGESMNITDVSEEAFLRHIEYGTDIKYSLINAETEVLLKTDMTFLYSATYATFKDQIIDRYAAFVRLGTKVGDAVIVDHERDGDLAITTYGVVDAEGNVTEEKAKVYVNYGDTLITVDGVDVNAMSYEIV